MSIVNICSAFVQVTAEEAYERMSELHDTETVQTSSLTVVRGLDESGLEVTVIIGASDEAILITPAASQS